MAASMTGFGRGEACGGGYQVTVELKAVNHRFLEVMTRLPRQYGGLEERIRKTVQEKIQRGRIDIFVNTVETGEKKRLVKVDKDLALSYDKTLKDLALQLKASYETDIYRLAALPEVLQVEDQEADLDALWEICETALLRALEKFSGMRRNEGEKLTQDLRGRLDLLRKELEGIAGRAENVVADYRNKLQERIQALLGETVLDEARLANEVAFFADRASITEELVRFKSHIDQSFFALAAGEPAGRKLDFLVQEMNREINTIGSKGNDLSIAQAVIKVKSELEKIREQIQNLE